MHNENKSDIQSAVIILAGGKSARAETTKGLRMIQNSYWIDIQIQYFISHGFRCICIGLGYDYREYYQKSKFISQKHPDVYVSINSSPENGSFSTLLCALKKSVNLPNDKQWNTTLIIHIDHALPNTTTLESLTQQRPYDVIKPVHKGTSGHPILISKNYAIDLLKLSDNCQLNAQIKQLPKENIYWLKVNDKGILYNCNTKENWKLYLENAKLSEIIE